jgi:O-antigen/teichoic acid export membrane protein
MFVPNSIMKKQSRQALDGYSYNESSGTQLGIKTLRGAGWSTFTNVTSQVVKFAMYFVLARFLSPADFGLVGMATVAIAFAQVFQTGGLGLALIQRKNLTESQVSSTFWAIVCLAGSLTVILLALSPLVGRFYNNPQIASILAALAFAFFFGALSIVPRSLVTRTIDFRALFFIEIGSALLGGIISLIAAYQGFAVWSLVIGTLVESLSRLVLFWAYTKWLPKMVFEFSSLKPILPIALPLLAAAVVQYFAMNMDYLIIGKYLGPVALGFYTLAYKIMLSPLSQISEAISRVFLPGFSSIQEDKAMIGKGFLKLSKYISFIIFPAMAGLMVVAPEVIQVFLGTKWLRASEVLRILSIVGAITSVSSICSLIFLSQGRTDILLKWSLLSTACYVGGYFAGLPWGINGVAWANVIACTLLTPFYFLIAFRLLSLDLRSFAISLAPASFGAITLGLILGGLCTAQFMKTMNVNSRLFLLVFTGVAIYAGFNLLFRRQFLAEIQDTLKQALRRKQA